MVELLPLRLATSQDTARQTNPRAVWQCQVACQQFRGWIDAHSASHCVSSDRRGPYYFYLNIRKILAAYCTHLAEGTPAVLRCRLIDTVFYVYIQ